MNRNRSEFSKDYLQSPPENEGLRKRTFLKAVAFVSLGMTPFLNSCGIFSSDDMKQQPGKKPDSPAKDWAVPKAARPPIDLAAPAKIGTATFALG